MTETATSEAPVATEAPTSEAPAEVSRQAATAPVESFSVPDAYKDKGWAQNIKSMDDLYSQFDNAQSMIGKKSVPSSDASDEQWNEFFSQLRPEAADNYQLITPEGFEGEVNEEVQGQFKQLFHDIGLTDKQAQRLFEGYIDINKEAIGQEQTPEQMDAEFKDMMSEKFGDKATEAIKVANKYIGTLGEEAIDTMNRLPNEQLSVVIQALNNIHKDMGMEDSAPESSGGSTGTTIEELRSRATALRAEIRDGDPMNPDTNRKRNDLANLDAQIAKHLK